MRGQEIATAHFRGIAAWRLRAERGPVQSEECRKAAFEQVCQEIIDSPKAGDWQRLNNAMLAVGHEAVLECHGLVVRAASACAFLDLK